jgi:hypothetical protein
MQFENEGGDGGTKQVGGKDDCCLDWEFIPSATPLAETPRDVAKLNPVRFFVLI